MTVVQGTTLFVGTGQTLYYLFFSIVEIAPALAVVWISARWKKD